MKKINKPAVAEKSEYFCDVTGEKLGPCGPAVTLRIHCGYGSVYDGDSFEFHLSDEAAAVMLPLLRALLLDGQSLENHRYESLFCKIIDRELLPPGTLDQCLLKIGQLAARKRRRSRKSSKS